MHATQSSKIVIRLTGGLGNQLFQYATGRAVALRNGCDLVLDIRPLELDPLREYELHQFNIAARVCTPNELPPDKTSKIRYLFWRIGRDAKQRLVKEKSRGFDPNVFDISADRILHGYWQCEKYFIT